MLFGPLYKIYPLEQMFWVCSEIFGPPLKKKEVYGYTSHCQSLEMAVGNDSYSKSSEMHSVLKLWKRLEKNMPIETGYQVCLDEQIPCYTRTKSELCGRPLQHYSGGKYLPACP